MLSGAKVFSATTAREREELGDMATQWLRQHPEYQIVGKAIMQSSCPCGERACLSPSPRVAS
jgi:hypothetical protein